MAPWPAWNAEASKPWALRISARLSAIEGSSSMTTMRRGHDLSFDDPDSVCPALALKYGVRIPERTGTEPALAVVVITLGGNFRLCCGHHHRQVDAHYRA